MPAMSRSSRSTSLRHLQTEGSRSGSRPTSRWNCATILILTPIICPMVEERPGPTVFNDDLRFYAVDRPAALAEGALSLTRIRALLEHQVQLRRDRGDANLHLLDGLGLFGPGDTAD